MVWQVMFIDLEFHQSRERFYILYYLSLMSIPILLLQIKKNAPVLNTGEGHFLLFIFDNIFTTVN